MTDVPRRRILVVDDDPKLAGLLRVALRAYELQAVTDAESALQMVEAFAPDLFILDLILPGMRGTTLAILLRDMPAFQKTPIFIVSGLIEGTTADREPLRVLGFTAFAKPFDMNMLQKHVRLHLTDPESAQAALLQLQPGRIVGE